VDASTRAEVGAYFPRKKDGQTCSEDKTVRRSAGTEMYTS